MAMNNKQRWMGGVVLLGGGALLAALLLKGQGEQALTPQRTANPTVTVTQPSQPIDNMDRMHPLALDIETERQLLERQRAQREKMVAEQEAKTAEYLALQQKAEADAARRAAEEYAAQLAKRQTKLDEQAMSSDSLPPELIDDDAQQKNAEQRAEIERLAAQANVRADAAQKASGDAEKAAIAARERLEKVRAEKEALQKSQAAKVEKERLQLEAKQKAEREAKKKEQEMLAKQKLEDEARRKKEQALLAKQKAEDEAKRKKEQELQAKQKAEQDAKLKKEQEAAEKRKADELAKQKKEDELAAKGKAEEDKKKQEREEKQAKQDKLDKEAAARKANSKPDSDTQSASKKLEEERGRAILEGDNKPWMVQVAIASNQANADAVVAKLRAKGYKVKTSQTSKGVRVMVGPEKGRAAADALRNQVSKDGSINAKSAWVIDWQSPE